MLLSVISVIAIVTVRKNINNVRNTLYNVQIKNIEDGAKNWVIDNIKKIPTGETTYVTLGKLKKEGYIDDPITSPHNDKLCFPNELRVEIVSHQSGKYDYNVLDDEIEYVDCIEQSTNMFSTIAIENTSPKYTSIKIFYSLDVVDDEDEDDFDIECFYGINEDSIKNSKGVTVDKENKTCTITNLKPDTKYYFSLDIDLYGKKSNSEIGDETTKKAPQIVVGAVDTTYESMDIPYTISKIEEDIDSIHIKCSYGTASNNITTNDNVVVDELNNNCTITNLLCDTNYYYTLNLELDGEVVSSVIDNAKTEKIFGGTYVAAKSGETHKGIVYMDPTKLSRECNSKPYSSSNPNGYKSTTGTKSGCMRFYIYNNEGDYYDMILDHNTTSTVTVSKPTGPGLFSQKINEYSDQDAQNWQINYGDYTKIRYVSSIHDTDIARKILGKSSYSSYTTGTTLSFTSSEYSWLHGSYWTISAIESNDDGVWSFESGCAISSAGKAIWISSFPNSSYGIRPVIKIYKSLITAGCK